MSKEKESLDILEHVQGVSLDKAIQNLIWLRERYGGDAEMQFETDIYDNSTCDLYYDPKKEHTT